MKTWRSINANKWPCWWAIEYLHKSVYKSTHHRNFLLMLSNDAREEINCISGLPSGSPLCWGTSVSVLWLKSIKSLEMKESASPMSRELKMWIPDPTTRGSPGPRSPPGFAGWGLCAGICRRERMTFCKYYLHKFSMRQAGEATQPQRLEGSGER